MTLTSLKNFATTATVSVALMAITPTLASAKPAKKSTALTAQAVPTAQAVAVSAENAPLAKDLIAFNNAINATAIKSKKMQEAFVSKHKNDKSPDVQVQFIKEGLKSLDQQKADLQAVKLTEPKAIAMRDKFVSTIEQQKSAYTFMVNTPKPTQAEQSNIAKQMAQVQAMGEQAQNEFIQLAKEVGLQSNEPTK